MTLNDKYQALVTKASLIYTTLSHSNNECVEVYEFLEVLYQVTIRDYKVISIEQC